MKQRALTIFHCVGDDAYYMAHAGDLPPATRELVEFMRACGKCSSWAWHGESPEAREVARVLIALAASEPIAISPQRNLRRAA